MAIAHYIYEVIGPAIVLVQQLCGAVHIFQAH